MHDGLERQAIRQPGRLGGIAHDDGRHGNDPLRQFEHLRDLTGRIDRRPEVTDAQSVQFGLDAEVLRGEQGVGRGIEEPGEVVISGFGLTLLAPLREAVHVGTDRHHTRGLADHRLVEMARRQTLAQGGVARHDERIELHVAAGRGPRGGFETLAQHLCGDRRRAELSDRTMLEKHTFHGTGF